MHNSARAKGTGARINVTVAVVVLLRVICTHSRFFIFVLVFSKKKKLFGMLSLLAQMAFDIGRCPQRAVAMPTLCITHGHLDHIGGLHLYVASRRYVLFL